jgi:hypothetical protein
MGPRPHQSLQHEYSLFVEQEIEHYKESVSRTVLLGIGDEAVEALAAQPQLALTELILCDEVDRIIRARLRLPTYTTWRRRRLRAIKDFSRPERWGLNPNEPLVREVPTTADGHVLVAGAEAEGPALYLAAKGCAVTAVESEEEVVEKVISRAVEVGLAGRVRGFVSDLGVWRPDIPLNAVVCTPAAFAGLSDGERAHVITLLQNATADGGVHLVQTLVAGQRALSIEELRQRYLGWQIELRDDERETFLARKAVA